MHSLHKRPIYAGLEVMKLGRKSTLKGKRGELELQEIFKKYGYELQRGGTQSYGKKPDLYGLPHIHIEAKRCETISMPRWLQQAKADALKFKDGCPCVFFRRNNEPWYVTMNLEAWLKLYESYTKEHKSNANNNK